MRAGDHEVCNGAFMKFVMVLFWYDKPKKKATNNNLRKKNLKEKIAFWRKCPVGKFKRRICYMLNGHALDPQPKSNPSTFIMGVITAKQSSGSPCC